jgi:hypothetical protein
MMKKFIFILLSLCIFSLVSAQNVHQVASDDPWLLFDGETGQEYKDLRGKCSMNWKAGERYGFFNAKIKVKDVFPPLRYQFQLVSISNCTSDYIKGIWDIKRNGTIVAKGIVGKLYGINLAVGDYFKFYGGDSNCYAENWHLSAYISYRLDY